MQAINVTYVLISDASRARLFEAAVGQDPKATELKLLKEFEHPQSRAANHDLVTDRPGRIQQSGGPSGHGLGNNPSKGNRSAMEPPTSPKEVEHVVFARELAQELEKALHRHAYDNLIVAANPEFLGLLRGTLSDQVKKHLTGSLDKDYTSMDVRELSWRLSGMMPQ